MSARATIAREATGHAGTDRSTTELATIDRVATDRAGTDRSATGRVAIGRSATDHAVIDRATIDRAEIVRRATAPEADPTVPGSRRARDPGSPEAPVVGRAALPDHAVPAVLEVQAVPSAADDLAHRPVRTETWP